MSTESKPLAVVTGASSGIGLELAKQFALHNYDLIIAAAHGPGLDQAAAQLTTLGSTVVDRVPTDLATYDGVELLYARIQASTRPVDALALNAGVGMGGDFTRTDLQAELRLIQLNCVSVVHLAKRLLPDMVARRAGKVLVTASISGAMPTPFEAVYGASKAFAKSFAESLRSELKDTGVTVTALMPGPTETNFFHRAGMDDTKIGQSKKDDPADIARQGFDALMAGKDHIVAGSLKVKAHGLLSDILPESTKAAMHRKLAEPGSGTKSHNPDTARAPDQRQPNP